MTPVDPRRPVRRRVTLARPPFGVHPSLHVVLHYDGTLEMKEAWHRGDPIRVNLGTVFADAIKRACGMMPWADLRDCGRKARRERTPARTTK